MTEKKIAKNSSNSSKKNLANGNTRSQISPAKHWCFTLNNYTKEEIEKISSSNSSKKYIFQEETGTEGTKHLQGYIEFTNKVRPKNTIDINRIHWEKCRNIKAAIEYCKKGETRTGEIYSKGIELPPIDPIKKYREWQTNIMSIIKSEPDDRTINWILDYEGNKGKTALCKHICLNNKNAIYLSGKASDMKYAIAQLKKKPTIILMDFSRSIENFVSYQGIEEIKNGIFFSNKYESGMVIYNPPHVICFSNFMPDLEKLSKDRWNLIEI